MKGVLERCTLAQVHLQDFQCVETRKRCGRQIDEPLAYLEIHVEVVELDDLGEVLQQGEDDLVFELGAFTDFHLQGVQLGQ